MGYELAELLHVIGRTHHGSREWSACDMVDDLVYGIGVVLKVGCWLDRFAR